MEYYRQCKLVRGNLHDTAWIPEQFAKTGKFIKIRLKGEWVNGWEVKHVGSRLPEDLVKQQEVEYRSHRKVTDI